MLSIDFSDRSPCRVFHGSLRNNHSKCGDLRDRTKGCRLSSSIGIRVKAQRMTNQYSSSCSVLNGNDANNDLVMPDARGAWAEWRSQLRSLSVIGARRFHAFGQVRKVTVDGAKLHFTFSSFFQTILRTRIRKWGYILPSDMSQHTLAASNYLARMVILQMAVVLRNKLEACGQVEQGWSLAGAAPCAVRGSQLVQIASLVETLGVFAIQERFHDRVLYVAQLAKGDGNYGVSPESVSMEITVVVAADSISVFFV